MALAMLRRAKPLLGTIVEIRANCDHEASFVAATDAAFARIANIHRAMSFHEPQSDLQAVARCRAGEHVVVDQDTWNVLQLALQIERDSESIFNPTIAPMLVRNGLLPHPSGVGDAPNPSTLASSIRLDESWVVQVLQPVWIDLGGIAKGYAVDAATVALIEHGVHSGVVNAGGDLRVFGDAEQQINLRHPVRPDTFIPVARLRDMSCATSGDYFVARASDGTAQSAIIGDRTAHANTSVIVFASSCAVADALTKVLWLAGLDSPRGQAILDQYDAQAAVADNRGVYKASPHAAALAHAH